EAKTVTFRVTRHVRPKKRCAKCSCIVQAPAPSRPIEKSFAGASLLALILTWKYGFHIPLYRQCQLFAHAGLTLSRTTLVQWVSATSELLGPLAAAVAKHVLSAPNINADDTWIKVLAPGTGKTKKGHLWTYVRDGRPWGSTIRPRFGTSTCRAGTANIRKNTWRTSPASCRSMRTRALSLCSCQQLLVKGRASRRSPAWRMRAGGFFDLYEAIKSPLAKEALDRIAVLYQIEDKIRGCAPDQRRGLRQAHAVPVLNALHAWMMEKVP